MRAKPKVVHKKAKSAASVPFEPSNYIDLKDTEVAAKYLSESIRGIKDVEEKFDILFSALSEIVKAQGVQDVADKMEMSRDAVYKILASHQNPTVKTLSKLLNAVDLEMAIVPRFMHVSKKRL